MKRMYGVYLPTGEQHPLVDPATNCMHTPTTTGVIELHPTDDSLQRKITKPELNYLIDCYRRLLLTGEPFQLGEQRLDELPEGNKPVRKNVREMEKEGLATPLPPFGQTTVMRHIWQPGDMVFAHTLQCAHRAPMPEEIEQVRGTRILQRAISLAGTRSP